MSATGSQSGLRISLDDVEPLRRLARSIGVPGPVDPGTLGDDTELSLVDYFRLVQRVSLKAGDEACRMSRRPLAVGTHAFMIDTVAGARDLEDAMRRVARAYNLIHGGDYNRVERRDGRLIYVVDDQSFPYASDVRLDAACALVEGILIFLHAMLGLGVGRDLEPLLLRVRTRRPRRTGPDGFLAFWRAPVRCNAASYALEYAEEAASLAITPGRAWATDDVYDAVAAMIGARSEAGSPDFLDRVTDVIASGVRDQPAVARRLGVSVATLRRRLETAQTSFRELRAHALDESARALLARGREVGQVAELLGFSDARSFSRAFKAWNGVTPATFAHRAVSEFVLAE